MACVGMSFLAGLSTTIGSGVVFAMPGNEVAPTQMAFVLALAGGVMLSATVLEFWLPVLSSGNLVDALRVFMYSGIGAVAFLCLSWLLPEPELVDSVDEDKQRQHNLYQTTPGDAKAAVLGHSPASDTDLESCGKTFDEIARERAKRRLALVLMISLTAHNFPEGFAVAVSSLESRSLGFVIMFAIAMHNIPEGIAISVPVLAATSSRKQALWMSFLSGMAEPVGAVFALGMVQLVGAVTEASMENLLCVVGGVMLAVSMKELFPEAYRQDRHGASIAGTISGFLLMLVTIYFGA